MNSLVLENCYQCEKLRYIESDRLKARCCEACTDVDKFEIVETLRIALMGITAGQRRVAELEKEVEQMWIEVPDRKIKLSKEVIGDIKEMSVAGYSKYAIAKKLGLTWNRVDAILGNKFQSDVNRELVNSVVVDESRAKAKWARPSGVSLLISADEIREIKTQTLGGISGYRIAKNLGLPVKRVYEVLKNNYKSAANRAFVDSIIVDADSIAVN